MNLLKVRRPAADWSLLAIPLSCEEYENAQNYLGRLRDAKVHYNYADLAMVLAPKFLVQSLMPDVEPGCIPSHVFCSQAALLVLKNALMQKDRSDRLPEILAGVNSRTCTPNRLYRILQQSGAAVQGDVESFFETGHVPLTE